MKKILPFLLGSLFLGIVQLLPGTNQAPTQAAVKAGQSAGGNTPKLLDRGKEAFLEEYTRLFKEIEVETLNKKKFPLKELAAPVVILNFWASWCQPCLAEFPSLVDLKKKYNDQSVRVIAINIDDGQQEKIVRKMVQKYRINFDVVVDKDKAIFNRFKIESIPASIIFVNQKAKIFKLGILDFNSKEVTGLFPQKTP